MLHSCSSSVPLSSVHVNGHVAIISVSHFIVCFLFLFFLFFFKVTLSHVENVRNFISTVALRRESSCYWLSITAAERLFRIPKDSYC